MAAVDLLFSAGAPSPDLVFGDSGTSPVIHALGLALTLPSPSFSGVLETGAIPLTTAESLPAVLPALAIGHDNAVNRSPFRWAEAAWTAASRRAHACRSPHRATDSREPAAAIAFASASARRTRAGSGWQPMRTDRRPAAGLPWGAGNACSNSPLVVFRDLDRSLRPAVSMRCDAAVAWRHTVGDGWRELLRWARPHLFLPWGSGGRLSTRWLMPSRAGTPAGQRLRLPWQAARRLPPGVSIGPPDPPGPGEHTTPSTALRFDDSLPVSVFLVFGRLHVARPTAKTIIPILRAYLVVNEVTLLRVDGALPLPALSLSLAIDADSWVWGWQASLPASLLGEVLPSTSGVPVELLASVNGVNFRLLAEKVTRDRRFAQARITLSGRGLAAELGDPYAPVGSRHAAEERTAQQLMAAALSEDEIGLAWAIDWQLADWLVPAGAWSHSGTQIDACNRLAAAAGGYVQASRDSRTLHVLPRYPAAPWDWPGVSPDFSLPAAATTRESVEWLEKPAYNAVYLSGEGAGILAHVQRAGTAGDRPAPMVVDALMTHADVARQRGLQILADTGRQRLLTLDTPLLPAVGIYPVGSFVVFSDGADSALGIVRSLQITAAFPTVRQTLEIECHD